jgi:hypothetical protein
VQPGAVLEGKLRDDEAIVAMGKLVLLVVLIVIYLVKLQVDWSAQQRQRRRRLQGFEVKLNTGQTPVPEKKETIDHG